MHEADGIVVGGGPTPVYQRGLAPAAAAVRASVAQGAPYLGFSAGAMVAADRALVGGWRDGDRAVCDQDWSEGLEDLSVETGLGLVDVTVEVHASQGGLLGRAVAVTRRPGSRCVVAIDEGTCLTVPLGWRFDDDWQLSGSGFAWLVEHREREAAVRRLPD
ncbi:MAG: Type 1 glutamine amidotransferase-like domain-containing protein [Motilibacteraceae bacterium]